MPPSLTVSGASCRPAPSPTADAVRLDGLRAASPAALAALLERLPDPPWDVALSPDDMLIDWLQGAGFEPYASTVTVARSLERLPAAPRPAGVAVAEYRNAWAESFSAAEARAMDGLAFYSAMGSPTGFEQGEAFGAFLVARRGEEIVGFAQAEVPAGWIAWFGVVPEERRRGIGRLLLGELAAAMRQARGTHLAADSEPGTAGHAFWLAQGFRERGRRLFLIRQ